MEEKSNSSDGSTGGGPTMDMQQFTAFFSQVAQIQSHINKTNSNQYLSSPYYILPSENLGIPITNVILTGSNYSAWSKAMTNALTSKNKIEFIDGTILKPEKIDPDFKAWEEDRVTKFLRGLGEQYSTVKSQVMLMDDLPSVNRILSMITQEERQLFSFDNALDAKILVASSQPDNKSRTPSKKGHHCEKLRHIVDNCYKKHGYPPNFKPRFEKKSHVLNCMTAVDNPEDKNDDFNIPQLVRGEPTINEFTPEQREALLALLSKQDVPHSYSVNQISAKANPFPYTVSKLTASLHGKMSFTDKACEIQDLHTLKMIGAASNVDVVKTIRTDNGPEFLMPAFYSSNGISHQRTCIETSQQNGIVERKHQHILAMARTLLFHAHLPKSFWNYSVGHAVYLINRLPTPFLQNKSPYQVLYKNFPNLSLLRVFGCLAYASSLARQRGKLDPRARKCLHLRFREGTKGYLLFDLQTREIFLSRDVQFYENCFSYCHSNNVNNDNFSASTHSSHVASHPFDYEFLEGSQIQVLNTDDAANQPSLHHPTLSH
ncbi:uncharacterized protein [Arachis hypogaea]|uniref:uncharacterized protein n=1 Tax=Arachis hypogaea TaxID=3818 RepID=UPI003B21ACBA